MGEKKKEKWRLWERGGEKREGKHIARSLMIYLNDATGSQTVISLTITVQSF